MPDGKNNFMLDPDTVADDMNRFYSIYADLNENIQNAKEFAGKVMGTASGVPAKAQCPALISACAKTIAKLSVRNYLFWGADIKSTAFTLIEMAETADHQIAQEILAELEQLNMAALKASALAELVRYRTNGHNLDTYLKQIERIWKLDYSLKEVSEEDIRTELLGTSHFYGYNRNQPKSSDPVNLCTGNFIYDRMDLYVHGKIDLELKRFYNAMDLSVGLFGRGWKCNLEERISEGQNYITLERFDGAKEHFLCIGKEKYQSIFDEKKLIQKLEKGYILYDKQLARCFDRQGKLFRIVNKIGGCIKFDYIENKLVKIYLDSGEYISFEYDSDRKICKVSDHSGREVNYFYNQYGYLVSFIGTTKTQYQYEYDSQNRVCGIIRPDEKYHVKNEYDSNNRVVCQYFPDGGVERFEYNGNQVMYIQTDGSKTIYTHDKQYRIVSIEDEAGIRRFSYTSKGQLRSETDRNGNTIRYSYDKAGNLISFMDPYLVKVKYQYDTFGRMIKEIFPDGAYHFWNYDEQGNLIGYGNTAETIWHIKHNPQKNIEELQFGNGNTYQLIKDNRNNIVEVKTADGVLSYNYDSLNRMISFADANGNVTCYTYDEKDRITSITNAMHMTRRIFYHTSGKPLCIIDYDGTKESYQYDENQRMKAYIDKNGFKTEYEYDYKGNCIGIKHPDLTKEIFTYDFRGNIIKRIDENGNRIDYSYDANGNCVSIVSDEFDCCLKYDKRNRLSELAQSDVKVCWQYDRAGHVEQVIDGCKKYFYSYDSAGRISIIKDDEGNEEKYFYYFMDLVSDIYRNGELEIHNSYSPEGLLIRRDYKNGYSEYFSYDASHNLTVMSNDRGYRIQYEYDCLNRPIRCANSIGIRESVVYDPCGRILEIKRNEETIYRYLYDAKGLLTDVIDTCGGHVSYCYDSRGRLQFLLQRAQGDSWNEQMSIVEWQEAVVLNRQSHSLHLTEFIRDKCGVLKRTRDALGILHPYDEIQEQTDVRAYSCPFAQWKQIENTPAWHADLPGNISARLKIKSDHEYILCYQKDAELLDYYRYKIGAEGEVDLVETIRKDIPDANGVYEYQYDQLGRLTNVCKNSQEIERYEYDVFGNRIYSIQNGIERHYHYDVTNSLMDITDSSKLRDRRMSTEEYQMSPMAYFRNGEDERSQRLILKDPFGNAIRYLNGAGETIEAIAYDSFGKQMESYQSGISDRMPIGFCGYERSEQNDIYYSPSRIYNSSIGRFESRDSERYIHPGLPDSANLYIYARNNPIRYQDPDGHDPEENEFAILRKMGLTEYLKRSYKMIWDELSYSNEHFATFGTFDMLTYAFSGLEYGILKANGADINYLEVLSRNQTAKAYGFIDGVADFSIGALEASIKKAGANYKNLYNYIKSNIDGSCQDNIDTRFRTIKLMSQQALTGLPVYDFYEIAKYIHSKEFRNKVVLEALGTEIEIISVGGIGNYVKQKYLQYLDSPEVTDVYYGFGYTAGVLVDIIIGEYLESELVGAVFKDTFNTAQAAPKAEKAVAESGEEVLEQAEKAAGKAVEESGEEILEQTGKAIEGGSATFKYKEVKTFTAEETNQWFIDNVKPDYKPPYKPGTIVKEIELTENATFVRVYDNMPDGSGMYGSWVMKAEDIEGLTPLEIQNKFALPNTPKYVCDVELEAGTHIRVGEVNPLDGWGSGGGTQYDLIGQRIGDFKNERLLEGN